MSLARRGACAAVAAAGMLMATSAVAKASPLPPQGDNLGLGAPAGLRAAVRAVLGDKAAAHYLQQAKLTASDGAANDDFGQSVALVGTLAVIGSPGNESKAGAVYVFAQSGTMWSEQAELTASDGATGDEFGTSVSASGTAVLVGAPGNSSDAGAAYVFVRSGSTWSQQAELTPSDAAADDGFGTSVSISGSTALIGASGSTSNAGAAYVFTRSGSKWSQQAELTASDAASGDHFGQSVSVSGSTAIVGAPGAATSSGAAYVFQASGASWSQQAELTASDGANYDLFGTAVAVAGTTAVVGAIAGGSSHGGAAYVFSLSGTIWSQSAMIDNPDDPSPGRDFGIAVALSGTTLLIGAPGDNSYVGEAFAFGRSGSVWSEEAKIAASDGASNDQFGNAIAASGKTVLVGASLKAAATGAAYVFDVPLQPAELTATGGQQGDSFGTSVAVSGSTAVVGAPDALSGSGAAYVFTRKGKKWSEQAVLTASGAAGAAFGSSVAMTGSQIVVGAPDEGSTAGAAYVFTGSGATWTQQAELTASNQASADYFGYSVAISGSTVAVGAFGQDASTGAAYVFDFAHGKWSQQADLVAGDAAPSADFGYSVAVSSKTLLVGAYGSNSGTGAAYVFARSGSVWSQQAELTASDGTPGGDFGNSVALAGSTAVVGADLESSSAGTAYVFVQNGDVWSQQAELVAGDAAPGDEFGASVALAGSSIVVGADGTSSSAGTAYVFNRTGTAWPQEAELSASDGAAFDGFGTAVAESGTTRLIGAPGHNSGTGAAYVFTVA
ncbi:MAG: FG-GAP repeat protein [Acidimicrobiales bacterium]